LAIRERPVELKQNEEQKELSNIKTWCCINQGKSSMWCNFEKNVFTPLDVAKAIIHVNNGECGLKCNKISFQIE